MAKMQSCDHNTFCSSGACICRYSFTSCGCKIFSSLWSCLFGYPWKPTQRNVQVSDVARVHASFIEIVTATPERIRLYVHAYVYIREENVTMIIIIKCIRVPKTENSDIGNRSNSYHT
jgi:hypothetical protein